MSVASAGQSAAGAVGQPKQTSTTAKTGSSAAGAASTAPKVAIPSSPPPPPKTTGAVSGASSAAGGVSQSGGVGNSASKGESKTVAETGSTSAASVQSSQTPVQQGAAATGAVVPQSPSQAAQTATGAVAPTIAATSLVSVDQTKTGVEFHDIQSSQVSTADGAFYHNPLGTLAQNAANGILSTRTGLESLATSAALNYGIPPAIFKGLISQESMWDINALSGAGAVGLTQLIPKYAIGPKGLNVNPFDPVQNIEGGAKYLSQLYGKYGNWHDALSAYNIGPGAYDKFLAGNRTLPKETVEYPGKVMAYANGYGGLEAVPVKNSALKAIQNAVSDTGTATKFTPWSPDAPAPLVGSLPVKRSPFGISVSTINPDGTDTTTGRDALRDMSAVRDAEAIAGEATKYRPTELITHKVKLVTIDPMTGQPVVEVAEPKQNWFGKLLASGNANPASAVEGNASLVLRPAIETGVTTQYVSPDGSIRTVQQAREVAIPPGVVPKSVASSWWEKALARPAANANVSPGLSATGDAINPITSAPSVTGASALPVMSYAAMDEAGSALPFGGTSITVRGGAPVVRTFDDVLDTHSNPLPEGLDVAGGAISPPVVGQPVAGGAVDPVNTGIPIAGGVLDPGGLGSSIVAVWNGVMGKDTTASSFNESQTPFGNTPGGSNSPGGNSGSGSSVAVHHNPFNVPNIADNPFAPQYFGLDDLAGLFNGAGNTGSNGNGSLASSGGGISPTMIIAALVAIGAAFYFLRHKVKK